MKSIYLHIFILLVISAFLRFIWLDRFPTGISGDELDYVLNAKAIALTGKDLSGLWSPLSFSTPPYEVPKAELPYLVVAPFIGPFHLSLFWARAPYALLSVLFVILMYLIALKLFSPFQAFVIGLVTAINPWAVYFGRTAFDTPLAIYFYFFAFYLTVYMRRNKIFYALPFYVLAFFSYIGTKIIYLPFLVITLIYAWLQNKKKETNKYVLIFIFCLIPFLYFIFTLKNQPVSFRTGDFNSINRPDIARIVDEERRLSIQTPLTVLFSNKLVIFTKKNIENYLGVFSINYLILNGENSPFISLWFHGIFYYLDVIFLLIGLCVLFKNHKKLFVLFLSIIIVAPLPSIVSLVGISYSIRASLMFPVMMIIIGVGIAHTIASFKLIKYRIIFSIGIVSAYLILLLNFLNILFFRNPIYASETFGFSGRELMQYVLFAEKENNQVVIVDSPSRFVSYFFKQYLFYANVYTKDKSREISEIIKNGNYMINNLKIMECPEKIDDTVVYIAVDGSKCTILQKFVKPLSISRLADAGAIYKIFNDSICNKYTLNRYPSNYKISDFNLKNLNEKQFCEKFVSNLN